MQPRYAFKQLYPSSLSHRQSITPQYLNPPMAPLSQAYTYLCSGVGASLFSALPMRMRMRVFLPFLKLTDLYSALGPSH